MSWGNSAVFKTPWIPEFLLRENEISSFNQIDNVATITGSKEANYEQAHSAVPHMKDDRSCPFDSLCYPIRSHLPGCRWSVPQAQSASDGWRRHSGPPPIMAILKVLSPTNAAPPNHSFLEAVSVDHSCTHTMSTPIEFQL